MEDLDHDVDVAGEFGFLTGPVRSDSNEGSAALQSDGDSAMVESIAEDLRVIASDGPAQEERKYKQRSWELTAYARACKRTKQREREVDTAQNCGEELRGALLDVAPRNALAMRGWGKSIKFGRFDQRLAASVCRLAFSPIIRGDYSMRIAYTVAASLVAKCILRRQASFFSENLVAMLDGMACGDVSEAVGRANVVALSWQWDETSQWVAARMGHKYEKEASSHAKVAMQIMMQHGEICTFRTDHGAQAVRLRREPWFVRGLQLIGLSTDQLLEGLSRGMPFFFDNDAETPRICASADSVLLNMACDRASSNLAACQWVWHQIASNPKYNNVLPHLELCGAHGVALVKSRPAAGKQLIASMHSLSALMRQWRFSSALRDVIVGYVRARLRVVRTARPAQQKEKARRLLELIYPADESAWMWRRDDDGTKHKRGSLLDLEALAMVVEFGSLEEDRFVHHCYVERDSPEHEGGASVGSACCKSFDESLERVVAPILNWILHRPWNSSSVNRWTYVVTMLKKTIVGFLAQRILPECLRELRALWGVDVGMLSELERLVAADANDYAGRNKLRLLRVCESLGPRGVACKLGMILTSLMTVDGLLYDIIGDGETPKATIAQLCDESSSPLAKIQDQVVRLLHAWGDVDSPWELFVMLGGCLLRRRERPLREVILVTNFMCNVGPLRNAYVPSAICFSAVVDPWSQGRHSSRHCGRFSQAPPCMHEFVLSAAACPFSDVSCTDARWAIGG